MQPPKDLTFLVLEDMDNLRIQMVGHLKELGVAQKIFEAPNVQSAIKIVNLENIDFVISDWNLPDGTGHDFLKFFRAIEKHKTTPFIMCTTNSEIKFFLAAVASGANDYVVKPWTKEDLGKKIALTWKTVSEKSGVTK